MTTPWQAPAPVPLRRPGAPAYPHRMRIHTQVAELPASRDEIADGDLIGAAVWAHLQNVEMSTFHSQLSRSRRHRLHDAAHPGEKPQSVPGDIPDPDQPAGRTPLWLMSTYRAWEGQRPGQSSSRGKTGAGSRGGRGANAQVRLPLQCPHCRHEITEADVEAAEGKLRESYAGLRGSGVSAAEARRRLELGAVRAKSLEMAWRGSRRGPLEAREDRKAVGA